jgi:hypothetical protein
MWQEIGIHTRAIKKDDRYSCKLRDPKAIERISALSRANHSKINFARS